jgi:hypothetical protein
MPPQTYSWTCSICSFAWVINALSQTPSITREEAASVIGYPNCVNETYGLMSSQCLIDAFATFGLVARQAWVTFDQAYAIMSAHTGTINPQGMYHFMGCRGVSGDTLWVANSALGYRGVWEELSRDAFNALGPVSVIYLPESEPT